MWLTIALVCFFIGLLSTYLWKLYRCYSYFEERGISTPPHRFFYGHTKILWTIDDLSRQLQRWTRQYGSIYGLYKGSRPMYIVSDVDFLEQVFIKQFSSFHSRHVPFLVRKTTGNHVHTFGATGARWYRQRHILNPTFSSVKLKLMTPLIDRCFDSFMKKLDQQDGEFDIYTLYQRLTMDVICHCAFGIDSDMQNDVDNEFFHHSKGVIDVNLDKMPLIQLGHLMPWLIPALNSVIVGQALVRQILRRWIKSVTEMPRFWLQQNVRDVIKLRTSRSAAENTRIDLLQLMIDAATSDPVIDNTDVNRMSKKLHYDEVASNVVLFMVAGYETTSTVLANSTYILAKHPDIQAKLQAEIDQHRNSTESDYDRAQKMTYLDWFVREVLRMFPIAHFATARECNQTTTISNHVIEQGCIIQPDVFSIHYNIDLWGPEDPSLFIPERHAIRRHPMALLAFGQGPRNCIGMRFALMELKLCLIHVLQRYTILPGEALEEKYQFQETLFIRHPEQVNVKIQKR